MMNYLKPRGMTEGEEIPKKEGYQQQNARKCKLSRLGPEYDRQEHSEDKRRPTPIFLITPNSPKVLILLVSFPPPDHLPVSRQATEI